MMDHRFEMWWLTDKMNIKRHLLHDIEPDACLAVITSTPVYQRLQYHNKNTEWWTFHLTNIYVTVLKKTI